jgi:hypothetical protein
MARALGAFLSAGGVTVDELCQWMVLGGHGGQAKERRLFLRRLAGDDYKAVRPFF